MENLRISKSAYYRLVEESDVSSLNVSLLAENNLPVSSPSYLSKYKSKDLSNGLLHHIELAIHLSKKMNTRLNLKFLTNSAIKRKLKNGSIDFSLSDMTSSTGWNNDLQFSHSYLEKSSPQGVLYHNKNREISKNPIVGVGRATLHEHYTKNNLKNFFKIASFAYFDEMVEALEKGKIDFLIEHPAYIDEKKFNFLRAAPSYKYSGHTGVATGFQSNLVDPINTALEKLHSEGTLQSLEEQFCGNEINF